MKDRQIPSDPLFSLDIRCVSQPESAARSSTFSAPRAPLHVLRSTFSAPRSPLHWVNKKPRSSKSVGVGNADRCLRMPNP